MNRNALIAAVLATTGTLCFASPAAAATPGTSFTYQGLLEEGGAPVTTAVDVRFTLYSDAGGTSQVGSPQTVSSITPDDGVFSAPLDFGAAAFEANEALWMRVEVASAGAGSFDDLGLQPLDATPFALNTRGLTVTEEGQVGVGNNAYTNVTLDVRQLPLDDFLFILEDETGSTQHLLMTDTGELGIGIESFTPLARLHAADLGGASDDPAALFQVHNCGDACGQPEWTENVRLWNDNPNGRTGIGFITGPMTLADVPAAYIGTGDGSNDSDLQFACDTGGVLTPHLTIDGTSGDVTIETGALNFPDGSVQTTAAPDLSTSQFLSIGPGSFAAVDSNNRVINSTFEGVWSEGFSELTAPINLPDGAEILSMTAYVHDTVAEDLDIRITNKINLGFNSNGVGYRITTAGSGGYTSFTETGSHIVDGQRALALRVFPLSGAGTSLWPGNQSLAFQNIVIEWRMP